MAGFEVRGHITGASVSVPTSADSVRGDASRPGEEGGDGDHWEGDCDSEQSDEYMEYDSESEHSEEEGEAGASADIGGWGD